MMGSIPPPEGATESASLIQFPCEFPIKVMGERRDGFAQEILSCISDLAPGIEPEKVEMRVSSNARYISLTVFIQAVSREQLDTIYLRLTSHRWVKVVL
jgi:putative lipoic acid-binding regulatory protein